MGAGSRTSSPTGSGSHSAPATVPAEPAHPANTQNHPSPRSRVEPQNEGRRFAEFEDSFVEGDGEDVALAEGLFGGRWKDGFTRTKEPHHAHVHPVEFVDALWA